MIKAIPTNLITGFLGSGKTTAILHLLANKPKGETWGVLVNEFGEIGIDGAMMSGKGAVVREVPGGCMCCVAGLPMQIGLNMLIARSKPDRILIEPTGLGHPEQILQTLSGEHYGEVLDLKASICLVDPGICKTHVTWIMKTFRIKLPWPMSLSPIKPAVVRMLTKSVLTNSVALSVALWKTKHSKQPG